MKDFDKWFEEMSEPINENGTLVDVLDKKTLVELKEIIGIWGFEIKSNLKKQDLIEEIRKNILLNINELFETLPGIAHLILLNEEIEDDVFEDIKDRAETYLTSIGLMFPYLERGIIKNFIPKEVHDAIEIDEDVVLFGASLDSAIVIFQGIINLFGVMEKEVYFKYAERFFPENQKMYLQSVFETVDEVYLDIYETKLDGKAYIAHNYVIVKELNDILSTKEKVEYKVFSDDDVMLAFANLITEDVITDFENLVTFIMEYIDIDDMDESEIVDMMKEFIIDFQMLDTKVEMVNVILEAIEIESEEEFNELIRLFGVYFEKAHRWKLKGNSTSDVTKNKNKSKRVVGNDMCPCGSGKEYKKCCLASDNKKGIVRIK